METEEKKTVKRPDRLKQLNLNKSTDEKVIKCSLQGILIEKKLYTEIQEWVHTISKVTHKASLLFNRIILHCLNNELPLPNLSDQTFYMHCFNIGVGRLNKSSLYVKEIWDSCFSRFPKINKCRGDTPAYSYAVKTFMTNFKNSIIYTFDGRQKAYIYKWCSMNNIDSKYFYAIRSAINGWGCKTEPPKETIEFINQQKQLLGRIDLDGGITLSWLGTHINEILKYYHFILKYMEQFEDTRKFTLAPITRIKCHHITIDTTVLYNMMANLELINSKKLHINDFMSVRDTQFQSVFNLKNIPDKGTFSYNIETDGVSCSIHFKVPKKDEKPISNKVLKKNDRVIAIDPGRSNLVYGVEKLKDNSYKTYKLTRGEYYTNAGMKTANRKSAKWEKDIHNEELIYRQHSLKTTSETEWDKFIKDYSSVYNTLWDTKLEKKWGRERFRVYCLKRKTLDTFFSSMNGDVKPIIAYGAAKFNPNSKHELSAPTTYVSKCCMKHFSTIFVDEYNTTKICSCCDKPLHPVMKDKKQIRGLRWCSSTNCRTLLNRDMNAAKNILRAFIGNNNRPQSLSRNSNIVKVKLKSLILY